MLIVTAARNLNFNFLIYSEIWCSYRSTYISILPFFDGYSAPMGALSSSKRNPSEYDLAPSGAIYLIV
jgi:hypothetical protein